jgi:predicted PurR-regulated permease PerM
MTEIKKTYKTVLFLITFLTVFFLLYILQDIVILVAISILLALIIKPFVYYLEKQKISRTLSSLIVFVSFLLLIYFSLSFLIPQLISQMQQLIGALKDVSIKQEILEFEKKLLKLFPFIKDGEISSRIENLIYEQMLKSFNHFYNYINSLVTFTVFIVIVPFLTFYILKDSIKIKREIIHLFPNRFFEPAYLIIKKVSDKLSKFVTGWIFDATFVGVFIGIGFYIIGINYSLPLGVIAGLGHLIPYLGPIVGGVPAIFVSILQYGNFSQVPLIILIVSLVYTFDNGFVQPYIFSKSVDMHPIIIILLIIAGGQLFGFFGMLFAIPVSTVIKTTLSEIYYVFKNFNFAKIP